jgi:hypothetical protein
MMGIMVVAIMMVIALLLKVTSFGIIMEDDNQMENS